MSSKCERRNSLWFFLKGTFIKDSDIDLFIVAENINPKKHKGLIKREANMQGKENYSDDIDFYGLLMVLKKGSSILY